MNLLPLINRKQRSNFVSPLAGKLYKNQHHSEHKVPMATISYADTNRSMDITKIKSNRTEKKIKRSFVDSTFIGS